LDIAQNNPACQVGEAPAGHGFGGVASAQDHRRVKEGHAVGQMLQQK
jgi:hypothetical protein